MTSIIKRNIRYAKVSKSFLTKIFRLNKTERQLVKLNEKYHNLDIRIHKIWVRVYYKGFLPLADHDDPRFAVDFEELISVTNQVRRLTETISKIEIQTGVSLDNALLKMYRPNAGRASQSF